MRGAMSAGVGAQPRRSPQFEADLRRLQQVMISWPQTYLVGRLVGAVLRLPPGPRTAGERVLAGVVAIILRLSVPVAVTTATASWSGAPVLTWIAIAALHGVLEVWWAIGFVDPFFEAKMTALPATLEHEADLRRVIDFTDRRWKARFFVPAAVTIALAILVAIALVAPDDVRTMHPGSLAMAVLVLWEFGEERAMRFLYFGIYAHESRYPHRLSWMSPADSPPVQGLLELWRKLTVVNAIGLTIDFVFVVLLVSPDSLTALLAPITGFALAALLLDTASLLTVRRSAQRLVEDARDATLDRLRRRIDEFEPRLPDLSPQELDQLRGFMATYAAVRDAPSGLSGSETVGHALRALAIPGVAFFIAVMVEVYAERLLDQFLP